MFPIRPQQSTQRLLTPGYGLGIGGKFTLALAKCRRMNLVAALDAHRGDDMVQKLMVHDELNKRPWHKGLIQGRMDSNQLRLLASRPQNAWSAAVSGHSNAPNEW